MRFDLILSWIGLALSFLFSAGAVRECLIILQARVAMELLGPAVEQLLFTMIVLAFIYGGFVYQIARLGYLRRKMAHAVLEPSEGRPSESAPSVAILVPSYKEEPHVVQRTLLSAALQEYGTHRLVLLIDDPPTPANAAGLDAMRALPAEIEATLEEASLVCRAALDVLACRVGAGTAEPAAETRGLAAVHARLAKWLGGLAERYVIKELADQFFVEEVLRSLEGNHLRMAKELHELALSSPLSVETVRGRITGLLRSFTVDVSSFERKRYLNLSHEPNKAMNLNSYIGLLGGHFREVRQGANLLLEPSSASHASMCFERPDYLVTLDADSVLLPSYLDRLVPVMENDQAIAVAQTPYSAFPAPAGSLERTAGATTDIQYILHQGFTEFDATFWVGANAVLRVGALEDIAEPALERGFRVTRYIQDRTVIEDTESSIDLARKGWKLFNYPERLSYSATPPDFGALAIQRERWANGGLIILPKLLRQAFSRSTARTKIAALFFRFHYLSSIALVNLGLIVALLWSFDGSLKSAWVPLTALPYYTLYLRDMMRLGYRPGDFLRVYALNLILVPINLAGVLRSIRQLITGEKSHFRRTPKVEDRTAADPTHLMLEYALALYCIIGAGFELHAGRPINACFAFLNGAVWLYGICSMIGLKETKTDLLLWLSEMRSARGRLRPPVAPVRARPGWRSLGAAVVLFVGVASAQATASDPEAAPMGHRSATSKALSALPHDAPASRFTCAMSATTETTRESRGPELLCR